MTTSRHSGPRVQLVGYFRAASGVGEIARLLYGALTTEGISCRPVDWGVTPSRRRRFAGARLRRLASPAGYDATILCINADQLPAFMRKTRMARTGPVIGVWAWEVSEFPAPMAAAQDFLDEVWTYSAHGADAIGAAVSLPTLVVPLPVEAPSEVPQQAVRPSFTFLSCFDMLSIFERKNPLGAIDAYCSAFPEPAADVRLMVKVVNGRRDRAGARRLREACRNRPDIELIDRYLSRDGQLDLIASCDAFVSLHRSEGYGLMLAEAMARAKPVIATGYSGNLEFMTADNSLLVGYQLVEVGNGNAPYPASAAWAEPDLDDAAAKMQWAVANPELAREIGRQARGDVLGQLTSGRTASFVRDRISQLWVMR